MISLTFNALYLFLSVITVDGKILAGEKLMNLANCKLFTKIFLVIIHRYIENAFGIYTDCSLFAMKAIAIRTAEL